MDVCVGSRVSTSLHIMCLHISLRDVHVLISMRIPVFLIRLGWKLETGKEDENLLHVCKIRRHQKDIP